ncbi:hypothetical protein ACFPIC_05165 [Arcanobacterium hippocoleae]|uniref:hypothetical protein n=2 Tax=Arcanobacterium hippocoleae TaxID=149017 RepID=UPI00286D2D1A|nr:hypothetical protein [Arcanobacterium hippocoleae]
MTSPLANTFSLNQLQMVQMSLMIISAAGVILAIANLAYAIRQKQQYRLSLIAFLLFLAVLFTPAILFFIGFMLGGVG